MSKTPTAQKLLRSWLKFSDANRFDDATWNPREAQEAKLLELMKRNKDTAYGREYGFGAIASVEDYRRLVPLNTYETLTPYIERTFAGEANVLTADAPVMFATTSGTTGRAKYIPVTPSYLHEYSHGVHVHLYRMFTDFGDVLEGKILVSSSSDEEGVSDGGLPYGAISGYLARKQPGAIKRFYALPYELSKVKEVESKYYLTLRYGAAEDVRLLVTPNPSSLLLLADKLRLWGPQLARDIRAGLADPAYVPKGSPKGLTAALRADPARADELEAIIERDGGLTPTAVWPNLRLISCWKGGTMPLYLRKLPEVFGDVPIRDLGYMASEGRGATPLVNSGAAGVLNVTSHFFEFIPEEDRDEPNPRVLTCDELESNREYYIYFTTSAGLYRYDINDVVRVVDWYRNTPVIQFVRKGQGMTSITGEKLTESQVTGALLGAVASGGFDVEHFTACVQWGEPPRYALYAELGAEMTTERCRAFVESFDRSLCAQNLEYESKRESGRLGAPVLKRVASGSYQALRQKRVAEGAPESQVKIPQLSTNMEFGADLEVLEEVSLDA